MPYEANVFRVMIASPSDVNVERNLNENVMSTKNRYRMFLRGTVYWIQDNETGKQQTLRTKALTEAGRLFNARNEARRQPIINLQVAHA